VVGFIRAKELIEPARLIVPSLQGDTRGSVGYFAFQTIEQIH